MPTALPSWVLIAGFVAVFALTVPAVGGVRRVLLRRAILDEPNARSSHSVPTPRGGGAGVLAMALPAWLAVVLLDPFAAELPRAWLVPALALALAGVSALDDLRGLPVGVRFAVQAAAVAAGLAALPGPVFHGFLPPALDFALAGLAWLWFVNLFNFMDGIDGISAVETVAIGGGLFLVVAVAGVAPTLGALGLLLSAGALAFLYWNWPPARVFLGDVGSVPLGFLLGYLILALAGHGAWAAAAILPLYYLGDATLTLIRRLLRRERVWRAHREHFYQQAVQRGLGHAAVSLRVAGCNAVLVLLALASLAPPAWAALAAAAVVVLAFLVHLRG